MMVESTIKFSTKFTWVRLADFGRLAFWNRLVSELRFYFSFHLPVYLRMERFGKDMPRTELLYQEIGKQLGVKIGRTVRVLQAQRKIPRVNRVYEKPPRSYKRIYLIPPIDPTNILNDKAKISSLRTLIEFGNFDGTLDHPEFNRRNFEFIFIGSDEDEAYERYVRGLVRVKVTVKAVGNGAGSGRR